MIKGTVLMSALATLIFLHPPAGLAAGPTSIPVKGDLASRAIQRAYNAILQASLDLPNGPSDFFIKDAKPSGNIAIYSRSAPGGQFASYKSDTNSTTSITPGGDIHCKAEVTTTWFSGKTAKKVYLQDFLRGADGSLTLSCSGQTHEDKPAQFKFTVDKQGKSDRKTDSTEYFTQFMDVASFAAPGGANAALALSSFICLDPSTLPAGIKLLDISPQQSSDMQSLRASYNNMLVGLCAARDGVGNSSAYGDAPSIVTSKNATGEKTVTITQTSRFGTFVTVETLRGNGDIQVNTKMTNPSQSRPDRVGPQAVSYLRNGDNLSFALDRNGRRYIIKTVEGGKLRCDPINEWTVPYVVGPEAPGSAAASRCLNGVKLDNLSNRKDFGKH